MLHAFALILSAISGTWSITTGNAQINLELRWSNGHGSNSNTTQRDVSPRALGIAGALASHGQHVTFRLHREAGDYAMEGWVGNGTGGGTYAFAPDETFFSDLRQRGIDVSVDNEITFADLDITREYIDDLSRSGYTLGPTDLITFRALRIDRPYIESLRAQGVADLNQRDIVDFKALGVSAAYMAMLARYGYAHLSAHDYVNLKALGVDEPYINDLAAHGLTHLSVEQLVNYKALGIR